MPFLSAYQCTRVSISFSRNITILNSKCSEAIPCSGVVLILPLRHHHLHTHCNKTCTHSCHKVIVYKMQKTSSSNSVSSRVIAGLSSGIIRKKRLAPLGTRPRDSICKLSYISGFISEQEKKQGPTTMNSQIRILSRFEEVEVTGQQAGRMGCRHGDGCFLSHPDGCCFGITYRQQKRGSLALTFK